MSKLRGVKKVRHIAGGFFGEVWQGEWEGVPVAIKVAKAASPKAVEALLREVEVAVSIKAHPNLVMVYGVCDGVDGELQLVLEYCEDGALLDWLRRLDKVCAAHERSEGHSRTLSAFCSLLTRVWHWHRVVCR
jgi:serine/threonine protein kinase